MFETRNQKRIYKNTLSLGIVAHPSDSSTWEAKAGSSLVQELPNYIKKKKKLSQEVTKCRLERSLS